MIRNLTELSPDRVRDLLVNLNDGNLIIAEASAHGLITEHLQMAHKIAHQHRKKLSACSRKGCAIDDLYGAAYLGVVQGVRWCQEGRLHDDGITNYLAVTVRRFCLDYCQSDHAVPIDRRALKEYYYSNGLTILNEEALSRIEVRAWPEARIVEEELIDHFKGIDVQILVGLIRAMKHGEIAKCVGISRPAVVQRIGKIRTRIIDRSLLDFWVKAIDDNEVEELDHLPPEEGISRPTIKVEPIDYANKK